MVFSYVTMAILAGLIVLVSTSVWTRYQVERDMAERRKEAERELHELKQRAAVLEAQVKYLEDERGIEAEIRNRFDVVKEGEQVVVILDDEQPAQVEDDTEINKDPAVHWYKFW